MCIGHDFLVVNNETTRCRGGLSDSLPWHEIIGFTVRTVNFEDGIQYFGKIIIVRFFLLVVDGVVGEEKHAPIVVVVVVCTDAPGRKSLL